MGLIDLLIKREEDKQRDASIVKSLGVEKWKFSDCLEIALNAESEKDFTDYKKLRPSSISKLGIVDFAKEALALKKPEVQIFSKRTKLTFMIGRAVHESVQGCVSDNGEEIFSDWKCISCGKITRGFRNESFKCSKCGSKSNFEYKEPFFYFPKIVTDKTDGAIIGGSPDLIIRKNGIINLVDIKTINDMWFGNLDARGPSVDYVVQVMIYMWLIGIECEGEIKGSIYYINKNDASEKEFGIRICKEVIDRAKEMRDFLDRCLIESAIRDDIDLKDMNKSIVSKVGEKRISEYCFPLS